MKLKTVNLVSPEWNDEDLSSFFWHFTNNFFLFIAFVQEKFTRIVYIYKKKIYI